MDEIRAPSPNTSDSRAAWDDDVERLYEAWYRRAAAAEAGHRHMSSQMGRGYLVLGVPIVVLTAIVGTSVFASLQDSDVPTGASPRRRDQYPRRRDIRPPNVPAIRDAC